MFNKMEPILISAAKITLFTEITRRYGCFYAFLVKFGRHEGRNMDGSWYRKLECEIRHGTYPGTDR